jgi:hypothetical protein
VDQSVPRIEPEDLERLAQQVAQWCREATTEFKPPSPSGCHMVASYLLLLRDSIVTSRQGRTATYAKNLLQRLTGEDESVTQTINLMLSGDPHPGWLAQAQEFQARVREAKEAIERLLPRLSRERDPEQDPIRRLAAAVREAWEETNNGRSPRSNNPDGPVCKFLVKALDGHHQSHHPDGISDILRGRRRNR